MKNGECTKSAYAPPAVIKAFDWTLSSYAIMQAGVLAVLIGWRLLLPESSICVPWATVTCNSSFNLSGSVQAGEGSSVEKMLMEKAAGGLVS